MFSSSLSHILFIAYPCAHRRRRAASLISIQYRLLRHRRALLQNDLLFLVDGCSWCGVAPLHAIVDVWVIAIDDDILGFGYPSSESGPIGSPAMSRPGTGDRVDTPAEGEEGDRKTMDENRTEDDESDDRLDGLCKELWLSLGLTSFRVWKLMDSECGNEYGT